MYSNLKISRGPWSLVPFAFSIIFSVPNSSQNDVVSSIKPAQDYYFRKIVESYNLRISVRFWDFGGILSYKDSNAQNYYVQLTTSGL